ncbi:MAG: DNA repair protein RadC [Marinilabiliaceae bacterium]|nr:DNA repair protein RadC [Marinilabiliaceae bacterium]
MENSGKLGIKEWAVEDRPREKLIQKGIQSLTDAELIAILIGSGSTKESAVDLSKKILHAYQNNLSNLGRCAVDDLKNRFHGIGEAKAITIVAALELGRRRNLSENLKPSQIKTSKEVYDLFHPIINDLSHEEFWILLLNNSNKVIAKHKISQGGIAGTIIDVRLIMKRAVDNMATSIILCHNHPSGNLQPSQADINITKKLNDAGKILDIPILDHIIVADNRYFSFADEGLM